MLPVSTSGGPSANANPAASVATPCRTVADAGIAKVDEPGRTGLESEPSEGCQFLRGTPEGQAGNGFRGQQATVLRRAFFHSPAKLRLGAWDEETIGTQRRSNCLTALLDRESGVRASRCYDEEQSSG